MEEFQGLQHILINTTMLSEYGAGSSDHRDVIDGDKKYLNMNMGHEHPLTLVCLLVFFGKKKIPGPKKYVLMVKYIFPLSNDVKIAEIHREMIK